MLLRSQLSNYPFVPAVHKDRSPTFAWWDGAFTDEEIEKIKEYAKTLETKTALVGKGEEAPPDQIRKTKVSWISNTPEASWIYDCMADVARKLNAQFSNFNGR